MKFKKILIIIIFLICVNTVYSEVGVGISPSKVIIKESSGSFHELEFLVYNTGSNPLNISLSAEGDIANFTEFEYKSYIVQPEPKPHKFPIKNGQKIKVNLKIPNVNTDSKYLGEIVATGSSAGSQFSGKVSVATEVQIDVISPVKKPFSYNFILITVLIFIVLFFVIYKFVNKKKSKK